MTVVDVLARAEAIAAYQAAERRLDRMTAGFDDEHAPEDAP
jgi:hypothetical protein